MKPIRLLLGFLTLLAALALQFWLVPFGVHADLAFTALIAFAFVFNVWELAIFVLFSVFILNWQPGLSTDIIALAAIPFIIFIIQRWLHVTRWIGGMVAIAVSLLVLYLVIAPTMIISSFSSFFLDVILCLAAGQMILWGMESRV
jgi:hypothetical protein